MPRSPTRGILPLTEDADISRGLRVAERAADTASVPGVIAAHRARDEQLVALCADPRRLRSLRVRCLQRSSVPAPAQLPATGSPPHAAQPELGCPFLRLRGLGLHRQLRQGL